MLRIDQQIKKKILNHVKRNKSRDVTDTYDRFEYLDEKRTALAKWEKLLLGIVGDDFYTDNQEADIINSVKEMRLGRAGVVPA